MIDFIAGLLLFVVMFLVFLAFVIGRPVVIAFIAEGCMGFIAWRFAVVYP